MTTPVVESVTETGFATATTQHLVDFPATVDAGDLMLLVVTNDNATIQTTPSGWTALDKGTPGAQAYGAVYALDAAGTEDGGTVDVVTASAEEMAAHMYRITNWGGTLGTDVDISAATTGTSDAPNPAAVTAGWGSDTNLFLAIVCAGDDDEVADTFSANYTNLISTSSSSVTASAQPRTHSVRRALTASSDDPGVWSLNNSEQWITWAVVIKPASSTTIAPRKATERLMRNL